MGVKGLWQLLQPVARPVKLEMLSGKRVAIDSSIWLYHFLRAIKDKQGHTLTNAHILGFLRRILKILFYGLKPVFVFDGGAPKLKKSTISERKNRREGARQSHALIASKLLSAQLRKAAIQQQQKAEHAKRASKGDGEEDLDENVAYFDDLNNTVSPAKKAQQAATQKKRRLDPYELPAAPQQSKSSVPDPRLATEDELRDFISTMKPSDFDTTSDAFKQLPPEVQYELIGDMRLKSRSTSFSRLETMLRKSSTAIDFSRAQIQNLMQRNDLTQKLINHSEGMGKEEEAPVALRVSTSRNREYVLMRKSDQEGGGWVLGIQDKRGQQGQKPIEISSDHEEDDEEMHVSEDTDDDDFDMEEVDIPPAVVSELPVIDDGGSATPRPRDTFEENEAESTGLDAALDESMLTKAKEDSLRLLNESTRKYQEKENAAESLDTQLDSVKHVRGVASDQASKKLAHTQPDVRHTVSKPPVKTSTERKILPKHAPAKPQEEKRQKVTLQDFQTKQPQQQPQQKAPSPDEEVPLFLDEEEEQKSADESGDEDMVEVIPKQKGKASESRDDEAQQRNPPADIPQKEASPIVKEEKADPPQGINEAEKDDDIELLNTALTAPLEPVAPSPPSPPKPQPKQFEAQLQAPPQPQPQPIDTRLDSDSESAYSGWEETPPPEPSTSNDKAAEHEIEQAIEHAADQSQAQQQQGTSNQPREMSPPIDIDASDNEVEAQEAIENEEKDYIAFSSRASNKNYDEMLAEADNDIRRLQQSAKKMSGGSDDPTMQMTGEIQKMLKAFGIPYITAPMEAEAQCAKLAELNLVDAVITDDSDIFLFGAPIVYKNMFNDKQFVECYVAGDLEKDLSLSRDRLIELAYILGSDYTNGFAGVGPVMAMELLGDFAHEPPNTLAGFKKWWTKVQNGKDTPQDTSTKFRKTFKKKNKNLMLEKDFPDPGVKAAYYGARIDDSAEEFVWGIPNLDELRDYLYNYLGWPAHKTDDTIIPVMKHMRNKKPPPQTSLDRFFDDTAGTGVLGPRPTAAYSSNRLKEVVKAFRGGKKEDNEDEDDDDEEDGEKEKGKGKGKGKKRPAARPRKTTKATNKGTAKSSKKRKKLSSEEEASASDSAWESEDN
ncbi:hypothetical protein E3P99_02401 [Wallemia hederae]|uniref:PIN domain-like protein n=1 Tax=Wallemia hederae TaxID=1540922 RepID=A0A4T0FMQ0_9BASI|nr:hypothetical protein E3P99_02401 [Wallemia hederae]